MKIGNFHADCYSLCISFYFPLYNLVCENFPWTPDYAYDYYQSSYNSVDSEWNSLRRMTPGRRRPPPTSNLCNCLNLTMPLINSRANSIGFTRWDKTWIAAQKGEELITRKSGTKKLFTAGKEKFPWSFTVCRWFRVHLVGIGIMK